MQVCDCNYDIPQEVLAREITSEAQTIPRRNSQGDLRRATRMLRPHETIYWKNISINKKSNMSCCVYDKHQETNKRCPAWIWLGLLEACKGAHAHREAKHKNELKKDINANEET